MKNNPSEKRIQRSIPPYLPAGIARCDGIYNRDERKWRYGCENCLRRIAARNHPFYMVQAPELVGEKCEFLIELKNN
jgi:hypothetical protein